MKRITLSLAAAGLALTAPKAFAQDAAPQITLGNGASNMIIMDGLARSEAQSTYSSFRVDGTAISSFRATTTAITFPKVMIENSGWLVLHPVIDGRPDGDMVSGFAALEPGENTDVTIQIDHPADPGDRFLVMLHNDVDEDGVFDFVFVEDGINVEDRAVFEGTTMIAHVFEVPE